MRKIIQFPFQIQLNCSVKPEKLFCIHNPTSIYANSVLDEKNALQVNSMTHINRKIQNQLLFLIHRENNVTTLHHH